MQLEFTSNTPHYFMNAKCYGYVYIDLTYRKKETIRQSSTFNQLFFGIGTFKAYISRFTKFWG